jgi:hypothetical protein
MCDLNRDDKCYVCQAFAKDLEERIGLTLHVTEANAVAITAGTCDRMVSISILPW